MQTTRVLNVLVVDWRVDIGVEAGVDGAGVAGAFEAFAEVGGDRGGEFDEDGEAADAAGCGRGGHVFFDARGGAGDAGAEALGDDGDGREYARCEARGDEVGR